VVISNVVVERYSAVTVPEAPGPKTAVSELAATIESPLGLPARLLAYERASIKKHYPEINTEKDETSVPEWNTSPSFRGTIPLLTPINVLSCFFR
jgi:hypothetical protein